MIPSSTISETLENSLAHVTQKGQKLTENPAVRIHFLLYAIMSIPFEFFSNRIVFFFLIKFKVENSGSLTPDDILSVKDRAD